MWMASAAQITLTLGALAAAFAAGRISSPQVVFQLPTAVEEEKKEEKKAAELLPSKETLLSRRPETIANPALNPNTLAKKMSLSDIDW